MVYPSQRHASVHYRLRAERKEHLVQCARYCEEGQESAWAALIGNKLNYQEVKELLLLRGQDARAYLKSKNITTGDTEQHIEGFLDICFQEVGAAEREEKPA